MPAFLLTFLIVALSAWLSIVSSNTPLFSKKKGIKIHESGWQVIILILLIACCSLYQNKINDDALKSQSDTSQKNAKDSEQRIRSDYAKTEFEMRKEYLNGVEAVTNKYESKTKELKNANDSAAKSLKHSYDTSTTNIVKALAEYGLTYNKRTDSVERLIKASHSPEPDFGFCDSAFTITDTAKDFIVINLNTCSYRATASNLNVKVYIVFHLNNGAYIYSGQDGLFSKNETMSADKGEAIPLIYAKFVLAGVHHIFVLLKGTFTNKDGSKPYEINTIGVYDFANRNNGLISPYFDEKVRSVLKDNGIN